MNEIISIIIVVLGIWSIYWICGWLAQDLACDWDDDEWYGR